MTFKELTEKFPDIPSDEIKKLIDSLIDLGLIDRAYVDGAESYEVTSLGDEFNQMKSDVEIIPTNDMPEINTNVFLTKKSDGLLN